jgi:hypothetical protein
MKKGWSLMLVMLLGTLVIGVGKIKAAEDTAQVAGTWELSMEGGQGAVTQTMKLQQDGDKIKGTLEGRRGETAFEGTVKGNEVSFTVKRETPNGTFTTSATEILPRSVAAPRTSKASLMAGAGTLGRHFENSKAYPALAQKGDWMKKGLIGLSLIFCLGVALTGETAFAQSTAPVRPLGVVIQVQPGDLTMRTDAGSNLLVRLPESVTVLQVPPGATDLKTAKKITVSGINSGDRVLIRGSFSEDQKSIVANSVIAMSKSELTNIHEAERQEWQQRGIAGVVKELNPATKELTVAVPNTPPVPGNPTHPVTIALAANADVLRYAPDSVRFSDAKPSTLAEIKVGDQVRALGNKNAEGTRLTAEKLVSGTFRNIGATVISADAATHTITVKNLTTGTPLLVRMDSETKLHRLPPTLAMMIARFNNGGAAGQETGGASSNGQGGGESRPAAAQGSANGRPNGPGTRGGTGGAAGGGAPRNFQQMLDRTPPFLLDELKAGEPLIVVSTEGAKPSEVTAITVLAGVEAILAARPRGSEDVNLGPWNMSMGGGGGDAGDQ